MNLSILIPQLFFDLIARVIPGAALIACAFLLYGGLTGGLQNLTNWSGSIIIVLLGNLLAAHIIGSLLGGIWFRIYRCNLLKDKKNNEDTTEDKERFCSHSLWLKWLHGWAKNGENRIDEAFYKTFGEEMPVLGKLDLKKMNSTGRVALIYDYLQLRCPKASARIAKLRAEEHMSGVLMIGFLLFALIFPALKPPHWSLWSVELVLLFSALTAGWLAWHLEKRAGTALFFSWYLVWSGIAEESKETDSSLRTKE